MGDVHFFCRIVPAYSPLPFRDTRGVLDAHTPEESEIMKRFRQNRHREPNSDHFGAWTTVNGPSLAEIRSPEGAARKRHPQPKRKGRLRSTPSPPDISQTILSISQEAVPEPMFRKTRVRDVPRG